jgi:hypothetical protein
MTNILATESRQTLKVGTKMASLHPDKYGYVVPRSWESMSYFYTSGVPRGAVRNPSGRCPDSLRALSGIPWSAEDEE